MSGENCKYNKRVGNHQPPLGPIRPSYNVPVRPNALLLVYHCTRLCILVFHMLLFRLVESHAFHRFLFLLQIWPSFILTWMHYLIFSVRNHPQTTKPLVIQSDNALARFLSNCPLSQATDFE